MTDQPRTVEDVKAIVEEHQLRFIRFWFTDILGQLKSFSINAAELDDAFEAGMGFDGSSITGFNAIEEGRARGLGQMPALLYQGKEAEDVAEFVAAVAGH